MDKSITDCTEELLIFLDKYMVRETKETDFSSSDSDILESACTDIIEIINVFVKFIKENSRMHDARLRMLDEAVRLMDRYKEAQEKYPHIDKIYEVFFNDLRISELLNAI